MAFALRASAFVIGLSAKQEDVPGVYSASYWVSTGGEGAMTPDVADLLDNYRVPVAIA